MANSNNLTDLDQVKKVWGHKAQAEVLEKNKFIAWMNYPYIERYYINQKISNHPEENWFTYVKKKYVPQQLKLGLNLGCGDGGLERHAFRIGLCEKMEAFDIAEEAITVARQAAIQQGLENDVKYEVADLNKIQLEPEKYDIAFASMSAHHFLELEHVFDEVRKALKPSGLFILNEFVGPSQFQWTDQQLTIINDLLEILPAKYRTNLSWPGHVKTSTERPSIAAMNSIDPSEAIRSAEIIPLLPKYFHPLERVDYGGTILHMLLQDIAGNFDSEKEEDLAILKLLAYFEETLIENKVLPSDFSLIVAQKNGQASEKMVDFSNSHTGYEFLERRSKETIAQLSGEAIAQQIPIRKLIKAVGFKVAAKPGFRWLYRYRGLGKKVVGG
jgi:SAM-dependent methyltransferase